MRCAPRRTWLLQLPEDRELLAAMVRTLLWERNHEKQRSEEQGASKRCELTRSNVLKHKHSGLKNYRWSCYGCNWSWSDLRSGTTVRVRIVFSPASELSQLLLNFAEQLEQKPIHPGAVPPQAEQEQQRRVKRRKGRRHLANFENLPVTTHVYELSGNERACPCCGETRHEIGADESWQVEYLPGHFERIHHIRKKYACAGCEHKGEHPRMEVAAKPEAAIDKGMAGPGLLAYIVTSKLLTMCRCTVWRTSFNGRV